MHVISPLRSIATRIFAGFFLVLLLVGVIVGMVWHAAENVGDALRRDAMSQAAYAQIGEVQIALMEARLRMAAYLRTENLVERGELTVAIDRLQALAGTPADAEGADVRQVGTMIEPVRTALSNAAAAVADRRSARAHLVASTASLSNIGTALAENAARLGDTEVAQSGAAVLADVAQTAMAASRAAVTDNQTDYATADAASAHGVQVLTEMVEASTGLARLQRLEAAARVAFDSARTALDELRSAVARRGERFAELTEAESRAIAISAEAVRSISSDQMQRRAETLAAQRSLRATVLRTAAGTGVFSMVIALFLGLSITRPLGRLARSMSGLAYGATAAGVPGGAARDEVGAIAGAVTAIKDRSAHLATHDALTDLPNRLLFHDRLDQSLAWSRREGASLAILYIDLDHFKDVNDSLGHAVGDRLLVQVAARLSACIRKTDTLARLGGDEFAIVHSGFRGEGDTALLATRLINSLAEHFEIEGHCITVGTSIGITMRNGTDLQAIPVDADVLLREADVALYQAKENGRRGYCFFEAEMNVKLLERRSLEDDIREALKDGQFELHYQPQIDVVEHKIVGAEALLRWHHQRRGEVCPADFIPLAEQTGLIVQIGEWVLYEACRQAAAWPELACIAVNVSPVQFRRQGFVDVVLNALREANLEPARLELEITEGVLMTDTSETLDILRRLRKVGVVIAMDDFGTGYSSLGYLRKFRFDKIKIDQSFVSKLGSDPAADEIVRAVLRMGHAIGIRVNAEGVEQHEQMQVLQEEGCEEVQGFLFGRPMSAASFSELLGHGLDRRQQSLLEVIDADAAHHPVRSGEHDVLLGVHAGTA